MHQSKYFTNSSKINYYLNLFNFVVFLIVITTGLLPQFEYHMHNLPDDYLVSGLNRSGWLLLHKISTTVFLTGIIAHCILHWQYITAATKKIFAQKSKIRILFSYYLLIICIPTCLTAIISWIFFDHKDSARSALLEIHDKLTFLLIIFSIVHIISRLGWMVKYIKKKYIHKLITL